MNLHKRNKLGFTLAELLIVVAIIAVLVAIAIPIFTKRLENSRETTDLANLRSAYAAGQVALLAGDISMTSGGSTIKGFNPDSSTGVVSAGAGPAIGKGTAVDGGVDAQMSGVPTAIGANYTHATVASGKSISLTFKDGSLAKVAFG